MTHDTDAVKERSHRAPADDRPAGGGLKEYSGKQLRITVGRWEFGIYAVRFGEVDQEGTDA